VVPISDDNPAIDDAVLPDNVLRFPDTMDIVAVLADDNAPTDIIPSLRNVKFPSASANDRADPLLVLVINAIFI